MALRLGAGIEASLEGRAPAAVGSRGAIGAAADRDEGPGGQAQQPAVLARGQADQGRGEDGLVEAAGVALEVEGADAAAHRVGEQDAGPRALVEADDVGQELVGVAQVAVVAADVALLGVRQQAVGEALAAPVEGPDVVAAGGEVGVGVDVLLDELGAALEEDDGAGGRGVALGVPMGVADLLAVARREGRDSCGDGPGLAVRGDELPEALARAVVAGRVRGRGRKEEERR